jgi:DNA-directed RNA polymerase subunit M/transcription elongation factor TFIIS
MKFRWCKTCRNYLYMQVTKGTEDDPVDKLTYVCRSCGYSELDEKGGLILETDLREKTSEGYKVLLNEFTRQDPTLPHVKNIPCPNAGCLTKTGAKEPDVIYIKYDSVNLKYLYMCNVCGTQWRSKGGSS